MYLVSVRIPVPISVGTVTMGGVLVTASGLIFVGATLDRGRQFIVATVGGNSKFGPNEGLYVEAYSLP